MRLVLDAAGLFCTAVGAIAVAITIRNMLDEVSGRNDKR